jgi:S-formylglutathione hydrolase
MSAVVEQVSRNKCFGGYQHVYQHDSHMLGCRMRFGIFLPSGSSERQLPALYYLSGLTCTEQNAVTKSGAQRYCEEQSVVWICPDTSPRGDTIADSPSHDLGQGAGFYVNATQEPWARHYRMYDYIAIELPELIQRHFPVTGVAGVFGHSMGGYGALLLGLSRPEQYRSVSAFSPICAPGRCPWGQKAFTAYLGADRSSWARYDIVELLAQYSGPKLELLIDQGLDDPFLHEQLKPELLEIAATHHDFPLRLRRHSGYDHSYYFIATFIEGHIRHAQLLHA